jgi:hypothetical protein
VSRRFGYPSSRALLVIMATLCAWLCDVQSVGANPPQSPTPPKPVVPLAEPIVATIGPSAVLPGSGTVTPTGEYSYNIPISVPPGRAGMQPTLSLTYSSRAGDGPAGFGWRVSGLSEIHRCAKIFGWENESDGVDLDSDDAICLDGNKLIPDQRIAGVYHAEREGFARIVRAGERFTVQEKNGRVLIYEGVATAAGKVVAWPLRLEQDQSDNEIRYFYRSLTGKVDVPPNTGAYAPEFLAHDIDRIEYTATVGSADAGPRVLQFHYTPRSIPSFSFAAGIQRPMRDLLTAVSAHAPTPAGTGEVWRYTLTHGPSPMYPERHLLLGVQLCASGTCTQAKQFGYHTRPQEDWQGEPGDYRFIEPYVWDIGEGQPDDPDSPIVLDYDGDGDDDLIYAVRESLSGNVPSTYMRLHLTVGAPLGQISHLDYLTDPHPVAVDVDAVGPTELVAYDRYDHRWHLFRAGIEDGTFPVVSLSEDALATAASFEQAALGEVPYFVDLDGDGLPDMVKMQDDDDDGVYTPRVRFWYNGPAGFGAPQTQNINGWSEPFTKHKVRAIDSFGNHRGGLYRVRRMVQPPYETFQRSVLHTDDSGVLTSVIYGNAITEKSSEVDGDFNGDGLRDTFRLGDANHVEYNTGAGTKPFTSWPTSVASAYDERQHLAVDVTGDGRDDLLEFTDPASDEAAAGSGVPDTIRWHTSHFPAPEFVAEGLSEFPNLDLAGGRLMTLRTGDFNGDGRVDLMTVVLRCYESNMERSWDEDDQAWTGWCGGQYTAGYSSAEVRVYLQQAWQRHFEDLLVVVHDEGFASPIEAVEYAKWEEPEKQNANCAPPLFCAEVVPTCAYPLYCNRSGALTVVRKHGIHNPQVGNAPDIENAHGPFAPEVLLTPGIDYAHYLYRNPTVDLRGRGFLGFESIQTWYPQRPMQVTTTYDNYSSEWGAYPSAGVPLAVTTVVPILPVTPAHRASGDKPLEAPARVTRVTTKHETNWNSEVGSHWTHPVASVTEEWEEAVSLDWQPDGDHWNRIYLVEGPPLGRATRRREAAFTFDLYGNLTKQSLVTVGGMRSEVETVYENRVADWLLGLPAIRWERSAAPSQALVTRHTEYQHDINGLLSRVDVDPLGPADQRQIVIFTRDSRGIITGVTRAAPGQATRNSYATYDPEGIFAEVTWNDLGHARWAKYHPAFGVPMVMLDNVALTHWVHDGLGRVREVQPDGAAATTLAMRSVAAPGALSLQR